MSNFESYQDDGNGNEVTVDHSSGIQTKQDLVDNPQGMGAQINPHAHKMSLQQGDASAALSAEAFEAQLADLVDTDTIIQHLEGAGQPVPDSMRKKRSQLNIQTQITGAGLPDDVINAITDRVRSRAA